MLYIEIIEQLGAASCVAKSSVCELAPGLNALKEVVEGALYLRVGFALIVVGKWMLM